MKPSEKTLKILINIARVLLGLCFVFSGFVKAVDPMGTTYKIHDYLEAFGLVYFTDLSYFFSVLLSTFEFFLGMALLLGVYKHTITLLLLLFMVFVTPLTLYIAIAKPVTDCGCFGDALVLSNTMTFVKNLFLLGLALAVFLWNDLFILLYGPHTSRWTTLWCILFPLFVSTYCSMHLPLFDFRPYKIGNHLPDQMKTAQGATTDSIATVFIYEKGGVRKNFTLDQAPVSDSTWKFVDRVDKVVREGAKAPIHDFVFQHPERGDITQEVLSNPSYTFLLVSEKLEDMNYSKMPELLEIKRYAESRGYQFLGLTSSNERIIEDWKYEYDDNLTFCTMDNLTLRTMIRSNPGLILLKNGTVYQKWGFRDIPDFSGEKRPLGKLPYGVVSPTSGKKILGGLILVLLLPLLFYFLMHKGYRLHFDWKSRRKIRMDRMD
jgi:uncharacterized membrane protein YphA (DoxX/SURF4 family)